MTTTILQIAIALSAVTVDGAPTGRAPWGNLRGRFVYDGVAPAPAPLNVPAQQLAGRVAPLREDLLVDDQGGIRNIMVYVRTKNVVVHPRALRGLQNQVLMEATNLRFEPHVLPMLLTQTLEFRNSEAFAINVNLMEIGGAGANPLLKPGAAFLHQFSRHQTIPQPVTCNIQPWCKAYVFPRDNPYTAVSRADGTFEIAGLPLGPLDFQVWHERAGFVDTPDWPKGRFQIDVTEGDNDLGTIKLDPQIFR